MGALARPGAGAAAAELEVLVEEQVSGSLTILHGKCGESVSVVVESEHAYEIDVADDVDVVQEERLIQTAGILEEKPGGFFQAAAGVEQEILAGDFDAHAKVGAGLQIIDNHVGEVMDVDNHFSDAKGAQPGEGDFEQR